MHTLEGNKQKEKQMFIQKLNRCLGREYQTKDVHHIPVSYTHLDVYKRQVLCSLL